MYKSHRPAPEPSQFHTVGHLPLDEELSRLLYEAAKGTAVYLNIGAMAAKASPRNSRRGGAVQFPAGMVNIVTDVLREALQRARAAADPAADALAAFLAREFGISEETAPAVPGS
jgi:hypothetical protein